MEQMKKMNKEELLQVVHDHASLLGYNECATELAWFLLVEMKTTNFGDRKLADLKIAACEAYLSFQRANLELSRYCTSKLEDK